LQNLSAYLLAASRCSSSVEVAGSKESGITLQ
jgi:hypothetical protein